MVDHGEVGDYADLARLGYVTRARVTQIMNLALLAPDLQEELLFATEAAGITEHFFRQINGMSEEESLWITAARRNGYAAVEDVWRRAGVSPATVTRLAEADTFAPLGLSRRDALWAARALSGDKPLPLFAGDIDGEGIIEPAVQFRAMTEGEAVVEDYIALRLTLRSHPMALLRPFFTPEAAARRAIEAPRTALSRTTDPSPPNPTRTANPKVEMSIHPNFH